MSKVSVRIYLGIKQEKNVGYMVICPSSKFKKMLSTFLNNSLQNAVNTVMFINSQISKE